ncbi:MAG TPA: nuclear transport factor 2 family protein [Actinopolymorphaceae bacterium]|jgi:ketosteroid isomerase-like protein|nr:nuclear transport factor 2 family protein [Actinopolymorphaceae bacterium]
MTVTEVEETIAESQQALNTALMDGDAEELERLVATDCRIVGPKGFIVAKDEWINVHSSGVYELVFLRTVQSEVISYGDAAVRCDVQHSKCIYKGQDISGEYRVLSVWVRKDSSWQLAAIQYTAMPANTPDVPHSREGATTPAA